jgi:gas vesicle protein
MANAYEGYNESEGGGSFVLGMLAGAAIGAGLALLFAPKTGSDLRRQLSEQAGNWRETASKTYRRAADTASDLADRGRELADRGRDLADRGRDIYNQAADTVSRNV